MLCLDLDYDDEVLATLVSCLLNSSPNLKDLKIHSSLRPYCFISRRLLGDWEKIDADCCVQNHLCSQDIPVILFIDALSESNPCAGLCHFLVMNARILQKVSIEYLRSDVKPEHAAKLEAIRSDLHLWPRASSNVQLELCPLDHYPCY
uniref:FBD domain-containing protein n=2 Tax=Oryza TaxID=4527 RepID=A0A0D3ETB2_9ORYZ